MSSEAGHVQITEFNKEAIPQINWMMEDLFCQYGVSLPWFMLDFDFPDYSARPDWVSGYNFNLDWGEWGYWLPWFNELLGLLFDTAHLPRWQMPDLSPGSWAMYNDYTEILYDNAQRHYVYGQSGTFIKDEVIEGETSGITGWYKWTDGDGYIHVANKQDSSGEPVADFEDEKIVGQTSGTYAWTYEDYWESPMSIYYSSYATNYITKSGRGGSCAEAWNAYDLANTTLGSSSTTYWGTTYSSPYYYAGGSQLCLRFDTTDAPTGATSIVLRIRVNEILDELGTPAVKVYKLNSEMTTEDWDGGSYITEKEIANTGYHDISLSDDNINQGGMTYLKLRASRIDGDRPMTAKREKVSLQTKIGDYTRLIFTR